jgi:hypothetical protein
MSNTKTTHYVTIPAAAAIAQSIDETLSSWRAARDEAALQDALCELYARRTDREVQAGIDAALAEIVGAQ